MLITALVDHWAYRPAKARRALLPSDTFLHRTLETKGIPQVNRMRITQFLRNVHLGDNFAMETVYC